VPFILSALYVFFAACLGWLIWKQERRKDRQAELLGLDVGRQTSGVAAIAVFSVVLAIVPTVIAWGLLQSVL
jgi:hypothetical protein